MKTKTRKTTKRTNWRRYGVLLIIVVLILGGGVLAYEKFHRKPATNPMATSSSSSGSQSPTPAINYNPPTTQEKQDSAQNKNDIVQQQSQSGSSSSNSGQKTVTPIITSADSSSVDAYVSGVFEDGGTCTATLTSGSQTITKSSTGFENASYTSCPPISLSGTNLGSKTWTVVVTYSSSDAQGTSQSATISP